MRRVRPEIVAVPLVAIAVGCATAKVKSPFEVVVSAPRRRLARRSRDRDLLGARQHGVRPAAEAEFDEGEAEMNRPTARRS